MSNAPIAALLIVSILNFLNIYLAIIFVRLLLTWFPNIDWMQQIVGFLSPITDPYLNLFRFIPPIGSIDISSILAIFALQFATRALAELTPAFVG
jgi:YggT family protein